MNVKYKEFIANSDQFAEVILTQSHNMTTTGYRLLSTLICIMSHQDWISVSLVSSAPSLSLEKCVQEGESYSAQPTNVNLDPDNS